MNKVELVGRLVKDPEVKVTKNQIEVCSFTLAVDRRRKNTSGERESDFPTCVAWRNAAAILGKYCRKGSRIGIVGSLLTRTYDADDSGRKIYVTEVVVDEIELLDTKRPDAVPDVSRETLPPEEDYPEIDDSMFLPENC